MQAVEVGFARFSLPEMPSDNPSIRGRSDILECLMALIHGVHSRIAMRQNMIALEAWQTCILLIPAIAKKNLLNGDP